MKTFLTTAATALVLSTSAFADDHTGAFADVKFDAASHVNASELIGMRVYASEADIQNNMVAADGEKEWDDIGEINEILLTRDGDVESVIVGVGGFLGIDEKDVAISMDQLKFISEEGESDDYFLVVKANAVGVEEAPAYEKTAMTDTMTGMSEDKTEMEKADMEAEAMQEERMLLTPPAIERDGYAAVAQDDLNTEDLTGARVYGAADEDIGEVSELLLTDDGKIDRAVLDIGGFLGLGEHSIAVSMDELQILREDGGADLRVYIESNQEALEAQPEYEG